MPAGADASSEEDLPAPPRRGRTASDKGKDPVEPPEADSASGLRKRPRKSRSKSRGLASKRPTHTRVVVSRNDEKAAEKSKQSMDHAVHRVSGPRNRKPSRMLAGYVLPEMHADGCSSSDTE